MIKIIAVALLIVALSACLPQSKIVQTEDGKYWMMRHTKGGYTMSLLHKFEIDTCK